MTPPAVVTEPTDCGDNGCWAAVATEDSTAEGELPPPATAALLNMRTEVGGGRGGPCRRVAAPGDSDPPGTVHGVDSDRLPLATLLLTLLPIIFSPEKREWENGFTFFCFCCFDFCLLRPNQLFCFLCNVLSVKYGTSVLICIVAKKKGS